MLLLLWLKAYTRRVDLRQRDAAQGESDEAKLERVSSACRHAGRLKMAARNLLAESRSARNEETWSKLVAMFSPEDHAAVSAAATAAAVVASTTEVDRNTPRWHSDNEYASEVLFDIISSRFALSGPGNDGQRFVYLHSLFTPTSAERSLEEI